MSKKQTMDVVINTCHGGFMLSDEAVKWLKEHGKEGAHAYSFISGKKRDHPLLVQMVRELGDKADGGYARLKIVQIPADADWRISVYDGDEWVSEGRTWR